MTPPVLVKLRLTVYPPTMPRHQKLERWMKDRGLSYRALAAQLGICHQALYESVQRGTFSRVVSIKLEHLTGWGREAFLAPSERAELRRWQRQQAA